MVSCCFSTNLNTEKLSWIKILHNYSIFWVNNFEPFPHLLMWFVMGNSGIHWHVPKFTSQTDPLNPHSQVVLHRSPNILVPFPDISEMKRAINAFIKVYCPSFRFGWRFDTWKVPDFTYQLIYCVFNRKVHEIWCPQKVSRGWILKLCAVVRYLFISLMSLQIENNLIEVISLLTCNFKQN